MTRVAPYFVRLCFRASHVYYRPGNDVQATDTADRFVILLRDNSPFVYCYPCLTELLGVPEAELRNAIQVLAGNPGLRLVLAPCSRCSEPGELPGIQAQA